MALSDDINAIVATEAAISSTRAAATPLLNALINAVNGLPNSGARTKITTALTPFVLQYNKLAPVVNDLHGEVLKLLADAAPAATPIPVPAPAPAPTVTADGVQVAAPDPTPIIDGNGDKWSFASTISGADYPLFKNGAGFGAAKGILLTIKSGIIWHQNSALQWWTFASLSNEQWMQSGAPFAAAPSPAPAPIPSPIPVPTPTPAPVPLPVPTSHNGGTSQINMAFLQFSNDYPFVDFCKHLGDWAGTDNSVPDPDVFLFGDNNLPTAWPAAGQPASGGIYNVFYIPPQALRPGNYVAKCVGNGSFFAQLPLVSGSSTSTNGAARAVYRIGSENLTPFGNRIVFGIGGIGPGAPITRLGFMHEADEALYDANPNAFGVQFVNVLRTMNPGTLRFLDWLRNTGMVTNWDTRRALNAVSYNMGDYRYYAGKTSGGGVNYALTPSARYKARFDRGAPYDKQVVSLYLSENGNYAILPCDISDSSATATAAVISTRTIPHNFLPGDAIMLREGDWSGMARPLNRYTNFWVSEVPSPTTLKVSLTQGGPSVSTAGPGWGTASVCRAATLDYDGHGRKQIRNQSGGEYFAELNNSPLAGRYATLVFDAQFDAWLKTGGCLDPGSSLFDSGVPPEICLELCKQVGAHYWPITPFYATDPMTDWTDQHAKMVKARQDSDMPWLIHKQEGINEQWNTALGFPGTAYCIAKALHNWGQDVGTFHDQQGKILSTIGQAMHAVYGGIIDGSKYQVMNGVQMATFATAGGVSENNPRLNSDRYVAQSAPAQTGFTKSAAKDWGTHLNCSMYIGLINSNRDYQYAWDYSVSHAGDAASQAATAEAYMGQLVSQCSTPNPYYLNGSNYLQTFKNKDGFTFRLNGYEGGYSPDIGQGYPDLVFSYISAIGLTNPCELTLASTIVKNPNYPQSGNPAKIGMKLTLGGHGYFGIAAIAGTTQLNGVTGTSSGNAAGEVTVTGVNIRGNPNIVSIDVDARAFTAYVSGGAAIFANSDHHMQTLLLVAAKQSIALGAAEILNYTDFCSHPGVSAPSKYNIANVGPWGAYNDIYQVTAPPLATAIRKFNTG